MNVPLTPVHRARSPFFPVLGDAAALLPSSLRDQYLVSSDDDYRVVLTGRMDQAWRRVKWLWPFFWLLAQFNILFPETGSNVRAQMVVEARPVSNGCDHQTWYRTFDFPPRRFFNATMAFDPTLDRVVEWVGPAHILQIVWHVQFLPPLSIRIETEAIQVKFGLRMLTLPSLLAVKVSAIERALSMTGNEIEVELVVTHKLLGPVFGYSGNFREKRETLARPGNDDNKRRT
jgi:hypothetical protein